MGLLEEQIEDGKELEPVTVFYDGESYWLADGFHRWHVHHNQQKEVIACIIYSGTRRDAVLYSVGANADHKPVLPRSREDKRRALLTLLQDSEWREWSNYKIAEACRVNEKTVRNIRSSLTTEIRSEGSTRTRTYKTKYGTIATMDTANIGKTHQKAALQSSDLGVNDNGQERLTLADRVTVTADHPLFPGQSGTITQLPNPDSAIVELDTGKRELINVRYLKPATAAHLKLNEGGLVEIYAPDNNKIDGRRGRIAAVREHSIEVWLRDVGTMTMQKHTLKHQQVTPLPLEKEPRLKEICARLHRLRECSLDPFEAQILALLDQPATFTPVELDYLVHIEKRYGIIESE